MLKTNVSEQKRTVAELVTQMRNWIVSGSILPNERLIEVDLADALKTNRANIRTALALLEQEGLVARTPNRGARVRLISHKEALEIAEARQVLEALVTRQAAERATSANRKKLQSILAEMEAALKSDDLKGFSRHNSTLHRTIREIAGNETVGRLLENLHFHFVRLQYKTLFMPGRVKNSFKEHREIVAAVCAGNPDRAELAMRKHLENIKNSIQWYIDNSIETVEAVA